MMGVRRIRHTVRSKLGVDIVKYRQPQSAATARSILLQRHQITLVLDVGANAGQYAQELRLHGYNGRILSFEPLSLAGRILEANAASDPLWDVKRTAVGAESGRAQIRVAQNSVSSSILQVTTRSLEVAPASAQVEVEDVSVLPLNDLYEDIASHTTFLKVDAQGYEGMVLDGASRVLELIQGVQLEMSLPVLYEGQDSFSSLLTRLEELEFQLVRLDPGFSDATNGEMLQVDGTFIRKSPGGALGSAAPSSA